MNVYVNNMSEFKKAIKENAEYIVVSEKLTKKLKPLIKIMTGPKSAIAMIIAFLTTSGVGIVASLAAAPASAGMSAPIALAIAGSSTVALAAKTSTDITLIVCLLLLGVTLSIPTLVSILNDYEVDTGFNMGRKVRFRFKATKKA